MSRNLAPWLLAATAATITTVTAAPAWADPIIDPAPIGPNQYFYGEVNNQAGQATIKMACFGPSYPGEIGHPLAGQTVKVLPAPSPTTSDLGFTGSAAHAIDGRFPTPTVTNTPVVLSDYAVSAAIPVSLTLPCWGTGKVAFVPAPTSPTARTATVTVSFVGQP
ncbi:MAG: hypothetical protein ACRDRO_20585 [Pseudonocardiaceae bacterium]